MTAEEKQAAVAVEVLAVLREIVKTESLRAAKALAHVAIATSEIIAKEGRVPSAAESIKLCEQRGWDAELH